MDKAMKLKMLKVARSIDNGKVTLPQAMEGRSRAELEALALSLEYLYCSSHARAVYAHLRG